MKKSAAASILIFVLLAPVVVFGQPNKIIPRGAKIYIQPNQGFEAYLMAALLKKKTPVTIVTLPDKADFIMTSAFKQGAKPGIPEIVLLGKTKANQDAGVSVKNLKTGTVCFTYSVHKYNAAHGLESTAEAIAKHLKEKIESGK